MTQAEEESLGENKKQIYFATNELGKLKIISQHHPTKKSIVIWSTPDNDDTEVDKIISDKCLLIVLEEKNEYYKVFININYVGWIHKNNTLNVDYLQ